MDVKKEYKILRAEIEALKEKAAKKCKSVFEAGTKEIFKNHPALEAFAWTQYTPYFNDGDACYFGAETESLWINETSDCDEDGNENETYWRSKDIKSRDLKKAYNDTRAFLGIFDDDDLEVMFGDHVKVTVDRKGAHVEEYDHE